MSQFCLKWDNYVDNMMTLFKDFLSTEALVDCTLACDGMSLKAHKIILSAFSPFFQSLFLENPCKHPIVILKDMKYTELKSIIEFMYHGEITVTQEQLSVLMKTARTLKVKGLGEVMFENNQSSDESEKLSGNESENQSGDELSQNSFSIAETSTPKRRRGRTRRRLASDHSDDGAFEPEIEQPGSDVDDALSGDIDLSSTACLADSIVPLQPLSASSLDNSQKELRMEQEQVTDESFASKEKLHLESSKQTLTDELPRRSSRTSVQPNIELPRQSQSSTDQSSSLVTSTSMSSNVIDNQQPESPQASSHKKLQKKPESKKRLEKSTQRKSSSQKQEVNDAIGYSRKVLNKVENIAKTTRAIEKLAVIDENASPTHQVKHHKSHKCKRCDYRTACLQSLRRHISTVHEKSKKFFCKKCDYKAALSQHLQRHIASIHEKKRLYRCKLCDYESSQVCNLQRHTKTVHEGLKPFKCQACDYRASQKMGVIKHYNDIHLKIKFFSCNFCKYETSRKENLSRHLKVHGLKKKKT